MSSSVENAREQARKKDGKFGEQTHDRADDVTLGTVTGDSMEDRDSLEGVPYEDQPKVMAEYITWGWNPRTDAQFELGSGQVDVTALFYNNPQLVEGMEDSSGVRADGLDEHGETIVDPGGYSDYSSGEGWEAEALERGGVALGDGGNDLDLGEAYAAYVMECRERGVRPFSDVKGHEQRERDYQRAQATAHEATARAAIEKASAIESAAAPYVTEKAHRAATALRLYREFAVDQTNEALDAAAEYGRSRGAAYMAIDASDDIESDDRLSGFIGFYDADGQSMHLEDDEGFEEAEVLWHGADRSSLVTDSIPMHQYDRENDTVAEQLHSNTIGGFVKAL